MGQLEVYFVDNANIKEVHLGQKDLHLNKKGKSRLELSFSLRSSHFSCSNQLKEENKVLK